MKCHRANLLFSSPPSAPGKLIAAASSPNPAIAAQRYLAMGFSVIPLRGKVPRVTWREYQQRRPTRAELKSWTQRGLFQNVGIVCGKVSGNLVVFDFDEPGAFDAFCIRFPDLTHTYTVATGGGGWHLYLKVDNLPPSLRGQGIEMCANGRMVVAPPSIHPNGKPYRVKGQLDIRHVPELSEIAAWIHPPRSVRSGTKPAAAGTPVNPALAVAIADYFRMQGYRQKGDWLNGPCIYPERHAHADAKRSFGFNIRTGYGWCFTCQCSMLAKEIAKELNIEDPAGYGGVSSF